MFEDCLPQFSQLRSACSTQWDFFSCGRIYFFGDEKTSNIFKSSSELARSGKVPPATVLSNSEIVSIQPDAHELEASESLRICASTRSAQKGPEVQLNLMKTLLSTSKMVSSSNKLVSSGDSLTVVDCRPHSGDHALGTVLLSHDALGSLCSMKHVMVRTKARGCAAAVEYSLKRIGSVLAAKWLKHEIQLRDESLKAVPPQTIDGSLTDSDKTYLKSIPGVWEAYEGVRSWSANLKVTILQGILAVMNSYGKRLHVIPSCCPSMFYMFEMMKSIKHK